METALAPLTLHRPQPLDVIAAAGAVGFDLTGIQFRTYGQQVSPLLGDPDFVVATKQALAASGVSRSSRSATSFSRRTSSAKRPRPSRHSPPRSVLA